MARRSRSKSLKNHPGIQRQQQLVPKTSTQLGQNSGNSGCKLWIWLCEYLIRRLRRRQNNNTQFKLILIRGAACQAVGKLFAATVYAS